MTANTISPENSAVILIDHQLGTMGWIKSIDRSLVELNTKVLCKVAKAVGIPLVLTSSMEDQAQGPLMPALSTIAPDEFNKRVQRLGSINCWNDEAFVSAVRGTHRKNLIMAGVTTDVCLAPPAVSARQEGFNVHAIVDASGSPTALADEMAFRKMERAGVVLNTTSAVLSELAADWASDNGAKIGQIIFSDLLS